MIRRALGVFIFYLLIIYGCAVQGKTDLRGSISESPVQWPEPPERARIRYLGQIKVPEDAGIRQGFLRRAINYITGNNARGFVRGYGVAVHGGLMAVADAGDGAVHIIDTVENNYIVLRKAGDHILKSPVGVAIDGDWIYVSDSEMNMVFAIDRKGRLVKIIGEDHGFNRPSGIALWREGRRLFVSDTNNHRICTILLSERKGEDFCFGKRGAGEGEFNFPTNVWFDERKKRLVVSDSMNFRIQIFDPEGRFISEFGEAGDSSGYFARPRGVAADSDGNIYVVDALFDTVQIFNEKGDLLLFFGKRGEGPGEFWLPAGIYVDEKDRIYVVDSYNRRIQIFEYLH